MTRGNRLFSIILALCLFVCSSMGLGAQTRFGSVGIGDSKTVPVKVDFRAPGKVSHIAVRTQGVEDMDFFDATGGTCTVGKAYAKGATCTVEVTFSPREAGALYGAVVLVDASAGDDAVATAYLQATGVGPQTIFSLGTWSSIGEFDTTLPVAVAVDVKGDLFVAQTGVEVNQGYFGDVYVEKRQPNGSYAQVELFGGAQWSDPADFGWISPSGIAVDGAGNVYVSDLGNLASGGEITGPAGVYKETLQRDGSYTQTAVGPGWGQPVSVAVDGAGNLYVIDSPGVYRETLQPDGSYIETTIGSNWGNSLALDLHGAIYVADSDNGTIYKETLSDGKYVRTTVASGFSNLAAVAVDGKENVYATAGGAVYKESPRDGGYIRSTIAAGNGLVDPEGLAVGGRGNAYFVDPGFCQNVNGVYCTAFEIDFADPPALHFENTAEGSTSADSPQTVSIENYGNVPLRFSAVKYPKDFPRRNSARSDCSSNTLLVAGGSCALPIDFSPVEPLGSKTSLTLSEDVTVITDALNSESNQQKISVSGTESSKP